MSDRKQSFRIAPPLIPPDKRLIKSINTALSEWGPVRKFPWREKEITPFHMLITEILLTKTRAEAVATVIEKLWITFPNPHSLAKARTKRIATIISPLGLIKRAGMLKECAQKLVQIGTIPKDRKTLLTLPGVGGYVADAVRVFAFNEAVMPIDAVIGRILRRVLGYENFGPSYADKNLWIVAQSFTKTNWSKYIVASLLDLGALICLPQKPRCQQCPLLKNCAYGTTYTDIINRMIDK